MLAFQFVKKKFEFFLKSDYFKIAEFFQQEIKRNNVEHGLTIGESKKFYEKLFKGDNEDEPDEVYYYLIDSYYNPMES